MPERLPRVSKPVRDTVRRARRRRTFTKMQMRDIRDGVSLAMSAIGTAVSVFALAISLSPRPDPEGCRLAGDLVGYFGERGVTGYTVGEMHRAICTRRGIALVMDAVEAVGGDAESRTMIRRLESRLDGLR